MTPKRVIRNKGRLRPTDPFRGSHIWAINTDLRPFALNEDGNMLTVEVLAEHAKGHFGRQALKFADKQLIAFYILSRVLFPDQAELYHIAFRDWLFAGPEDTWCWPIGVELVCTFLRDACYDVSIRPHLLWEEVQSYFRD